MVQFMKDIGAIIRLMDLGVYFIQMVMSMKENERTIKQMEKALIIMLVVLNTLENGWMISSMVMEKRFGQMEQNILEITLKVQNKEKECFHGVTELSMMESSIRI